MIISHSHSLHVPIGSQSLPYSSFVTKKYITDNSYTPGICTNYRFSLYLMHYKYMSLYIHIQKLTSIKSNYIKEFKTFLILINT